MQDCLFSVEAAGLLSVDVADCALLTDDGIRTLAQYCPALRSIILNSCNISDATLLELSLGCVDLESVGLQSCSLLTDLGISALALRCPLLRTLNLNHCKQITDIGLDHIGRGCAHLQCISLDSNSLLTHAALIRLSRCSSLQCISLLGCSVGDIGISSMANGCRNLTYISVDSSSKLSSTSIMQLLKNCSDLEFFYLGGFMSVLEDCLITIKVRAASSLLSSLMV